MKKTVLISLFITLSYLSYSQIGGISASKLATLCTAPVPVNEIEFEPAFSLSFANQVFTDDGHLADMPTSNIDSDFGFRFSYGAFKNFEVGIALPIDVSTLSYGMKYKLPFESKFSMGLLSGANFDFGNQTINRFQYSDIVYLGGLVATYNFLDKFSIDADSQYDTNNEVFINTDIGYYILDGIQFVAGFNYFQKNYSNSNLNQNLLDLNLGVTLERAENFILVLNSPISLMGRNSLKSNGFGFALTIMID